MIGGGNSRIVLCRFEYKEDYAEDYSIDVYDSLYGEYVVVGIEYLNGNRIRFQFIWRNENGAEQYYDEIAQSTNTIAFIDSDIERLQPYFHLPLTGVEDRRILETPSENGVAKTWKQMIFSQSVEKYGANYFNNGYVQEESGDVMFGIGRKTENTPNGGKMNIYKIYPTVLEASDSGNVFAWGDGQGSVYIDKSSENVTASHAEFSIVVSASSPTIITIETPDWVDCDRHVIYANIPEPSEIAFTVYHNNIQIQRSGSIVFASTSDSSKSCIVIQDAAGSIGGRLRIIGNINTNEQTLLVEGVFESLGELPQFSGLEWAVFSVHAVVTFYDLSAEMYDSYETDKYVYFGNINGETGYRKTILRDGNTNMRNLAANLTFSLIDSNLSNRIEYEETKQYNL